MMGLIREIISSIWLVTMDMAAFLLLGFLVAGLLSVFISPVWLERHLGRRNLASVFKASLFGVPLPLCSCGVIPVAASLRQHGASRAATTAFLLSTPQTGVDSIMVTYTLLGPLFAVFRPVIALLTGVLGGSIVQAFDPPEGSVESGSELFPTVSSTESGASPTGLLARMRAALDYGLVTLPADIGRALLVGVLIAGALAAVVPDDYLAPYLGQGPLSIALMMAVGIPLYVCATASVPLAAGFILIGASPGAALAFLVAGPATNAATITTINRVLGRRTMFIYLLTVAFSAFSGGILLDWLVSWASVVLPALTPRVELHGSHGLFDQLSAVALVVVMTWSWWISRRRGCGCEGSGEDSCAVDGGHAHRVELEIAGMHCSHCAGSVQRALAEMPGVADVQVFLEEGRALVRGHDLDPQAMAAIITGLGYSARPGD